jgi:hypothetical protein
MRKLIFFGVLALFSFTTASIKLVKTKVTDGIIASIPKDFKPMDDLDFSQRYPSVRKPLAAFTNADREVDFSVNISATQWPDGDLEIAGKFFKSSVINMFDNVEMISEGIQEIHGRKFVYFEFESRVKGDRTKLEFKEPVLNYTYIQYLVEPGRTLVFSFNCPKRLKDEWQPTAHKMMKSIKLN